MALDEQYIQEAADRVMIHDLLGRYAFAADYETNDPGAWAALFAEDGRFEIPIMKVVVEGRQALKEFAAGLQRTIPGLHHVMTNVMIDVDGDRASGKCELNEFLLRPEAIYNNLQGWYEDDYVRDGRRWLFQVRKVFVPRDSSRVTTGGQIGEYFKAYLEFCQQYRREG
ncbi:MAG: nuclear transport factor 2 family protein [Alphaproteobacteria bacterium]|jgi:hypothetical protein|nr:nuclear transport factor 2 family protein [Alphaproteobacteria bacterium]